MEWYLLTFAEDKKALDYAWGIMVSQPHCSRAVSLTSLPISGSRHEAGIHGESFRPFTVPRLVLKRQCRSVSVRIPVGAILRSHLSKLTPRLDRDGVRSKLIPEESDKRRMLFWDLVGADARLVSRHGHGPDYP